MRRALLVLFATARIASAGNRTTVAVVAVDVGPGVPAYLQGSVTTQIASGLAAAAYDVAPIDRTAKLGGDLARCRDESCMPQVARALGVDQIVIATITTTGESRAIDMHLFDASGNRLADLHDVCDLCGDSELIEHAGLSASALLARAAEPRAQTQPRSRVPGIAAIVAGTIVLGGGIALVAIDGHGSCGANDTPVYPDAGAAIRFPDPTNHGTFVCRDLYATKGLGIAGIAVGTLGLAVGVALVVRAGHRDVVRVAPTPGGATIGMTWSW